MRAFVFSIGEPTTELCISQLEKFGLDVTLYEDDTTLWAKLKRLYSEIDEDFVRVDADIIPNKNILNLEPEGEVWWHQSMGWDMYKNDITPISVSYIKKQALPLLREYIDRFKDAERPESQVFRLDEFHNPRRCVVAPIFTGLHGYKQGDIERVKTQKERRKQFDYDWELYEALC